MKLDQIEALLALLEGTDVTELEWEGEDFRVKVARGSAPPAAGAHVVAPVAYAAPAAPVSVAAAAVSATVEEAASNTAKVTSALVGTFYRAPGADQPPFVQVGSVVKKGDTLCIVEAMKLMNEIESEVNGKVVAILVENEEAVEFGQVLFEIEPS